MGTYFLIGIVYTLLIGIFGWDKLDKEIVQLSKADFTNNEIAALLTVAIFISITLWPGVLIWSIITTALGKKS